MLWFWLVWWSCSTHDPGGKAGRFSGWAAVLLLHLLALLLATVVFVDVNVSVVWTTAVAVAVIVTVMYPLWTHAMTVIIAIDNVDMTRRPFIPFLPHHRRPVNRPAVAVASVASASPCLQPVIIGRISCYHHLHLDLQLSAWE